MTTLTIEASDWGQLGLEPSTGWVTLKPTTVRADEGTGVVETTEEWKVRIPQTGAVSTELPDPIPGTGVLLNFTLAGLGTIAIAGYPTGPVSLATMLTHYVVDKTTLEPSESAQAAWDLTLAQVTEQAGIATGAAGDALGSAEDAEQARLYALGYRTEAQEARADAVAAKTAAQDSAGAAATSAGTATAAASTATTKAAEAVTAAAGAGAAATAAVTAQKGQPNGIPALNSSGKALQADGKVLLDVDTANGSYVTLGAANDSGFDAVLIIGQSNAQGDSAGAVSALIDVTDPAIWTFGATGTYAGQVVLASDPLAHHGPGNTVVGPGMAFARWYAPTTAKNRKVLLIPAAANGTAFGSGTQRWDPSATRDANNLYEAALIQTLAALAAAPNARIVAVIWVQGESDAIANMTGATYRVFLEYLIDGIRARLSAPNLPFLIGSMLPEFVGTNPVRVDVENAQKSVILRKPYTAFVQGPSGMGRGDGLHYAPAGNREQGRRLADGLRTARENANPVNLVAPNPPAIAAATAMAAPTGLAATPSGTSVTLTWTAAIVNFAAPLTDYLVQYRLVGAPSWSTFADAVSSSTGALVTGLADASQYQFQVAGINSVGTGAFSSIATATTGASVIPSITDDFARADSASSLGSTAAGVPWIADSGTWGISSNAAYLASTGNANATIDNRATDYTVQATVVVRDSGTALIWRCTDAANWYALLVTAAGSSAQVYKSVAGSVSAIAASITSGLANGDVLKVVVTGSTFTIFRNGTQIGVVTDTALTTGRPGIRAATSTARWDNFSVTAP